MFLMMAEVLELARVARSFPTARRGRPWRSTSRTSSGRGCSVHDMIQPSFSFLVGVALPFSLASRLRGGGSRPVLATLHAAWRALLLVALRDLPPVDRAEA